MGKQINIDDTDRSSSKTTDLTFPSARQEGTWGKWGIVPLILKLGTKWMWLVDFTTQSLCPQGNSPGTHRIIGWVDDRAGMDSLGKREISSLTRNWTKSLGRCDLITTPVQPSDMVCAYESLVRKPEGRSPRGCPHSTCEQHYNECQDMQNAVV